MLLAFIHWPQEGIPTSGYSQRIFRKEGLSIPTPASGRGGTQIWICFQTTTLSLRWRYLKNQREKLHTETQTHIDTDTHTDTDTHRHTHTHTHSESESESEKAFSWCEHACEETVSSCGMKPGDDRGYLRNPCGGFRSERARNFLLVPGEADLVDSWIFKQMIFQNKRGMMPTPCKQYSCFINLLPFSSWHHSCFG